MRKKIFRLIGVCLLIALFAALFVACDPAAQQAPKKDGVSLYFISNGGSRVETITARAGSVIVPPADPVREGYFFIGWYLTANAAKNHNTLPETLPTIMPSKSVTYYAGWSNEGAQIVLDPNGGALETTTLQAAIGAKLTEILRQYVPSIEEGIIFDGWYHDGVLVDESMLVPATGISLKARYSAYYRVNVYKEGLDGQDALDEEESINEILPIGAQRTYTYKQYDGYERTSDLENASRAVTISMDPADNVIEVYYDRLRVWVNFLKGNELAEGEESSQQMIFGSTLVLPENPFTLERHRFAGWKIGNNIFEEGATLSEKDMAVSGGDRIDVIAVWDERFEDKSGGVDVLWLLGGKNNALELVRENLPVMSGMLESSGLFTVTTQAGERLRGRLFKDDGLFTWDLGLGYRVKRYVGDDLGSGRVHPNDFARLSEPLASELHLGSETITGSYRFSDADGVYVFESAEETPRTFYFSVLEIDGEQVFVIRENFLQTYSFEDADGNYFEFALLENGSLELFEGVKAPHWLFRERVSSGSYTMSGGNYRVSVAGSEFDGKTFKVQRYGRTLVQYNRSLDGTFGIEGGGNLRLDGFSGAIYEDKDGNTERGEFYLVDGDVVFFGTQRSQHFERKSGGLAIKGEPEVYRGLVSANGAESIVINGHGKLRYVDRRGRVFYANYTNSPFDEERTILKFRIDATYFYYLVSGETATPTGAEAGVYAHGGAKLYLDGAGGATYEEGGIKYAGTYSRRAQAPFDYQLSGEASFRFVISDGAFKKYDATKAGEYIDKFDAAATLFLDGYGAAELREGDSVKTYSLPETVGQDIELTSPEFGALKLRLLRADGATNGNFVRFDEAREFEINRYDPSYFEDDDANIDDKSSFLADGYDGATFVEGGETKSGVITAMGEDGVFRITADGENFAVKVFEYAEAKTTKKLVYAKYDAQYKRTATSGDTTLEMDGYGILTLGDGEQSRQGYFCMWDGIVVVRGGQFEGISYFNVSGNSFSKCEGVVLEGGVVKRYIGDGGHIDLPQSATSIAKNAFRGSAVQSVSAARLDGGIGESAFEGCAQLESVSASYISEIGGRAFYGCERLKEISGTASSLERIGEEAFVGCAALSSLTGQGLREIGFEAFKGLSISVVLGTQLQNLTIRDRAFAHGDGDAPELIWSDSSGVPQIEGDPFAFDGEGEDLFAIVVPKEDQLRKIYTDGVWNRYAGFVCFAGAGSAGDYFSIASLEKIHFGRISAFDGKRWAYNPSDGNGVFIYYEPSIPDKAVKLTANVDEIAGEMKLYDAAGELKYTFVSAGARLKYTSYDGKTLEFVIEETDTLDVNFDGTRVKMSREEKKFSIGEYEYTVELSRDWTFAYTEAYMRKPIASYSNGDSRLDLFTLDEEGKTFALDGNYLLLTNGEEHRMEFDDNMDLQFEGRQLSEGSDTDGTYFFALTRGVEKVSGDYRYTEWECYYVQIVLSNGSYTAQINITYEAKIYTMRATMGGFDGRVVTFFNGMRQLVERVHIEIESNGQKYIADVKCKEAAAQNAEITVTLGEEFPPEMRGDYTVSFTGDSMEAIMRKKA